MSLAGSWRIGGEVTLPICSPLYEGHAGLVRLEIRSGISLKLFFESKLQLPCYGIVLRFVFLNYMVVFYLISLYTVLIPFHTNCHLACSS